VVAAAAVGEGTALRREIVAYWEGIRGDIEGGGLSSYVMDLCKLGGGGGGAADRAWALIELNPFAETTGGALCASGRTSRGVLGNARGLKCIL
jgi:hypothetical protein